ncbi:NADH-quinone oxidoreductase subunit J [Oscillatoriales cyanobacterium LEGE 11467]|uniref:NADH-quinone oxidoreductase subunit J n=1 Tax=Zarconia navalis LEGE 11467 TaxID=1828826 RepID=A0A928ZAU2_9CYAN|nr:NADH-quinone oxidoreductase subunit J [Zarconia navalis]MBE9041996.1 NADH-quinone oxidoreductase subunit J [Zarconia navalis LEGE 11467]
MNLAQGVQIVSLGLLTLMMISAALGVVLLDNIVYSAFLLGAVFTSIAGMYLLLNADFVAAAQLLIYVGSVNVLILFAIMLVNKREDFVPMTRGWVRKGATAAVCAGLFALLATMVLSTPWSISEAMPSTESTTLQIGTHFFTDFLLPFELVSVLLLMAMVGAIVIARRDIIPDIGSASEENLSFQLPERPREAVGALSESGSDSTGS